MKKQQPNFFSQMGHLTFYSPRREDAFQGTQSTAEKSQKFFRNVTNKSPSEEIHFKSPNSSSHEINQRAFTMAEDFTRDMSSFEPEHLITTTTIPEEIESSLPKLTSENIKVINSVSSSKMSKLPEKFIEKVSSPGYTKAFIPNNSRKIIKEEAREYEEGKIEKVYKSARDFQSLHISNDKDDIAKTKLNGDKKNISTHLQTVRCDISNIFNHKTTRSFAQSNKFMSDIHQQYSARSPTQMLDRGSETHSPTESGIAPERHNGSSNDHIMSYSISPHPFKLLDNNLLDSKFFGSPPSITRRRNLLHTSLQKDIHMIHSPLGKNIDQKSPPRSRSPENSDIMHQVFDSSEGGPLFFLKKDLPSAFSNAPSNRHEVIQLGFWLKNSLKRIQKDKSLNEKDKFHKADEIYNICFNELVRQVSLDCIERGELIMVIWKAYLGLAEDIIDDIRTREEKAEEKGQRECQRVHEMYNDILRTKELELESLKNRLSEVEVLNKELEENARTFKERETSKTEEILKLKEHLTKVKKNYQHLQQEQHDLQYKYQKLKKNFDLVDDSPSEEQVPSRKNTNVMKKPVSQDFSFSSDSESDDGRAAFPFGNIQQKIITYADKSIIYEHPNGFAELEAQTDLVLINEKYDRIFETQETLDNILLEEAAKAQLIQAAQMMENLAENQKSDERDNIEPKDVDLVEDKKEPEVNILIAENVATNQELPENQKNEIQDEPATNINLEVPETIQDIAQNKNEEEVEPEEEKVSTNKVESKVEVNKDVKKPAKPLKQADKPLPGKPKAPQKPQPAKDKNPGKKPEVTEKKEEKKALEKNEKVAETKKVPNNPPVANKVNQVTAPKKEPVKQEVIVDKKPKHEEPAPKENQEKSKKQEVPIKQKPEIEVAPTVTQKVNDDQDKKQEQKIVLDETAKSITDEKVTEPANKSPEEKPVPLEEKPQILEEIKQESIEEKEEVKNQTQEIENQSKQQETKIVDKSEDSKIPKIPPIGLTEISHEGDIHHLDINSDLDLLNRSEEISLSGHTSRTDLNEVKKEKPIMKDASTSPRKSLLQDNNQQQQLPPEKKIKPEIPKLTSQGTLEDVLTAEKEDKIEPPSQKLKTVKFVSQKTLPTFFNIGIDENMNGVDKFVEKQEKRVVQLMNMYKIEKKKQEELKVACNQLEKQVSTDQVVIRKLQDLLEDLKRRLEISEQSKDKLTNLVKGIEDATKNLNALNDSKTKTGSLTSLDLSKNLSKKNEAWKKMTEPILEASIVPQPSHYKGSTNLAPAVTLARKNIILEKKTNAGQATFAKLFKTVQTQAGKATDALPLKSVLKQITSFYAERIQMAKDSPLIRDQDMGTFVYKQFVNTYGFQQFALKKFTKFMLSVKRHMNVNRVKLFARMINLGPESSNFNLDETKQYIIGLEFLLTNTSVGVHYPNPDYEKKHFAPFLRAMEYVRIFGERKMTIDEMFEVKKEVEKHKTFDPTGRNPQGLVDIDEFLEILMLRYKDIMDNDKKNLKPVFIAGDPLEKGGLVYFEFMLLCRTIEFQRYDEKRLEDIFINSTDIVVNDEVALSFEKFLTICFDSNLFSQEKQNNFLALANEESIESRFEGLLSKWELEKASLFKFITKNQAIVPYEVVNAWQNSLAWIENKLEQAKDAIEKKAVLLKHKVLSFDTASVF